ncbi:hypothetical protein Ahy_A09g043020 isoform A [Arachis hypogaea]|uniref:TLDc domain-containing protein n=1 Tax=Arachis hypogaea TaxID=3818 RepID=A0A445BHH8_ARAHY|nr:hypothetical protein Ahy_A09g043020 isoform A [Arachis hypogaea]
MHSLKEKVSDKIYNLFSTSSTPSSSSPQASTYDKEDKSWSSYFSHVIPSFRFGGSTTSKHQDDLKHVQSISARYDQENFRYQDIPMDEYADCNALNTPDLVKDETDEDPTSRRSSSSSEDFAEAKEQQTPIASKEHPLKLTEDSTFISYDLYEFFESCIPNIVKGCHWVLVYRYGSTLKHGTSLRTLIRKSAELSGPGLLIVGDRQGAVFGGLLDCPLKPTAKRKYQGTNQTFVFTTIYGEPRLFRPTGKGSHFVNAYKSDLLIGILCITVDSNHCANRYYYMCLNDLLALGGGGNYALCLHEDLLTGTSGTCDTFGNKCLAHNPEFELKDVELWGFTHDSPRP